MINIILFDLGNVILPIDGSRLAKRLAPYTSLSAREILAVFGSEHLVDDFETGRLSPHDFYEQICQSCELKGLGFDAFIAFFNDIFDEDPDVIRLVASLKKKKYKLCLISNTNVVHVQYLHEKFPVLTHFDRLIFSNEAGFRKPSPEIYKMALSHFSAEPERAVFIDDLQANIKGAVNLGINAIQYRSFHQLTEDLSKLGVSI